jgi:hypothetical protein
MMSLSLMPRCSGDLTLTKEVPSLGGQDMDIRTADFEKGRFVTCLSHLMRH